MLRGHVFNEQLFSSECFALFIDTFLAKNCGVIKGCNLSNTTNSVTVSSGFFCVRGRFLEIEGTDTLTTGTDNAYCKLVCEIDLSKENTESELTQAVLKIIKSTTGYPSLTQQDITDNGTVYQFEFAQFKTGTNGITDFVDTRSYLDFDSIYEKVDNDCKELINQIKEELAAVENGSAYILKSNIAVVSGIINLNNGNGHINVNYPTGFNKNNCVVISICGKGFFDDGATDFYSNMSTHLFAVRYGIDKIQLKCNSILSSGSSRSITITAILLKINENPLIKFTPDANIAGRLDVEIIGIPEDYVVTSNQTIELASKTGTTRNYIVKGLDTEGGTDAVSIMISKADGTPFFEEVYLYNVNNG